MTESRWEDPDDIPPGLTEPVRAIRAAVPTSRHARMLFDMAVELLGARGVVETAGGRTQLALFLRETPGPGPVVPWPLLQFGAKGRLSTVMPIGEHPDVPPRPGSAPRLRNLGPGEIVLHDGPHSVTVTYGDDGRWMETQRGGDQTAFESVLAAIARGTARPVELLAEHIASLDPGRHGPGRVVCTEPVPSVAAAWTHGLRAIRDALFDGRIPADARWVVADCYGGAALASGATRDDAMLAWHAEVRRVRPSPSESAAGDAPPRGVGMTLRAASADGEWPEAPPAAEIQLEPVRSEPSSWGAFARLLGGFGGTRHVLLRRDRSGFTLVGDRLIDLIDLDGIDDAIRDVGPLEHPELDAMREAFFAGNPPNHALETIICRVVDERTLLPVAASLVEARRSHEFLGHMLDGDRVRLRVVQLRRRA